MVFTIQLMDVSKQYASGKNQLTALSHVNLEIQEGEVFGLIGHSGAGKSTLLRCINLLERPTSGQVIVDGAELVSLSKRRLQTKRQKIGMIFQHFHLLNSLTVEDNIAFPMRLTKSPRPKVARRVAELLNLVGLTGYERKYPGQLSGGQKQRVAIARALANDPTVLLCDEATSALDPQTTVQILELLAEINRQLGLTIVVVTHEMAVVERICDRVAVLDKGEVVETGSVVDVFLHPQHVVTQRLLEVDETGGASGFPESNSGQSACQRYEITFVGDLTYAPVLAEVAQQTATTFSILKGTIDVLKDVPFGRLLVEWYGDDTQTTKAQAILQERGCVVRVV
uniref:methionine ABC transporter ATP-binding protein n=1 Tax=Alicyclobacillus tolerans TaxID=90970 RepID=UPI003556DAA4